MNVFSSMSVTSRLKFLWLLQCIILFSKSSTGFASGDEKKETTHGNLLRDSQYHNNAYINDLDTLEHNKNNNKSRVDRTLYESPTFLNQRALTINDDEFSGSDDNNDIRYDQVDPNNIHTIFVNHSDAVGEALFNASQILNNNHSIILAEVYFFPNIEFDAIMMILLTYI